jgi:hypothetical protein
LGKRYTLRWIMRIKWGSSPGCSNHRTS